MVVSERPWMNPGGERRKALSVLHVAACFPSCEKVNLHADREVGE